MTAHGRLMGREGAGGASHWIAWRTSASGGTPWTGARCPANDPVHARGGALATGWCAKMTALSRGAVMTP